MVPCRRTKYTADLYTIRTRTYTAFALFVVVKQHKRLLARVLLCVTQSTDSTDERLNWLNKLINKPNKQCLVQFFVQIVCPVVMIWIEHTWRRWWWWWWFLGWGFVKCQLCGTHRMGCTYRLYYCRRQHMIKDAPCRFCMYVCSRAEDVRQPNDDAHVAYGTNNIYMVGSTSSKYVCRDIKGYKFMKTLSTTLFWTYCYLYALTSTQGENLNIILMDDLMLLSWIFWGTKTCIILV